MERNQCYIYRGYLQIACVDLTRAGTPALWFVFWDPTQPTATRPLAIQKDGNWFVYGHDLTKNVCEVFGPAGYIRTEYSYSPFGAVTSVGDFEQPFQWSSEFYDSELDLVYYNYRHYSPSLGRWLSRDPIEEQGGLNLYCFVGNISTLKFDIMGMVLHSNFLAQGRKGCCDGKEYYYFEHCCIKNEDGTEQLVSKNESVQSELTYVELRGRGNIPWLLQHVWLEIPPDFAFGFYPKDKTSKPISLPGGVYPEDEPQKTFENWGDDSWLKTKSKKKISLRKCNYDVSAFNACVRNRIIKDMNSDLNYIVLIYRDCEIWANDVISDCKKLSRRRQ